MNIKVSVIIPVYNMENYLGKCLLSCMNQSLRDIEIIVVNDGSRDRSQEIVREYIRKDSRIVGIDQENKGVIYARKTGVEKARGKYVFYLDGDDYIPENALELLYSLAEQYHADYVAGSMVRVYGDKISKRPSFESPVFLSGQDLLYRITHYFWELCGRLIAKSLFDDLYYEPLTIGEDLFINMQIAPKVNRGILVSDCVYYYVRHEGSATTSVTKDNSFELNLHMFECALSLLDKFYYEKKNIEQIYILFSHLFCELLDSRGKDVLPILKKYYWENAEIKSALWKKRKRYYLTIGGFIYCPPLGVLIMKFINVLYWLRRLV